MENTFMYPGLSTDVSARERRKEATAGGLEAGITQMLRQLWTGSIRMHSLPPGEEGLILKPLSSEFPEDHTNWWVAEAVLRAESTEYATLRESLTRLALVFPLLPDTVETLGGSKLVFGKALLKDGIVWSETVAWGRQRLVGEMTLRVEINLAMSTFAAEDTLKTSPSDENASVDMKITDVEEILRSKLGSAAGLRLVPERLPLFLDEGIGVWVTGAALPVDFAYRTFKFEVWMQSLNFEGLPDAASQLYAQLALGGGGVVLESELEFTEARESGRRYLRGKFHGSITLPASVQSY